MAWTDVRKEQLSLIFRLRCSFLVLLKNSESPSSSESASPKRSCFWSAAIWAIRDSMIHAQKASTVWMTSIVVKQKPLKWKLTKQLTRPVFEMFLSRIGVKLYLQHGSFRGFLKKSQRIIPTIWFNPNDGKYFILVYNLWHGHPNTDHTCHGNACMW